MISKNSRLLIEGKELKLHMLKGMLNKEKQCKISSREYVRTEMQKIARGNKPLSMGVYTYWTKHKSIVNSEPYIGYPVSEELVYRYGLDNGYFTEWEVSFEDFSNDNRVIKNKYDEGGIQRQVEDALLGFRLSTELTIAERRNYILDVFGEEDYDTIKDRVIKKYG